MKLFKKIKSIFKDDSSIKTEKIIIVQKSCPHCASRGMFVFDNTSSQKFQTNFNDKKSNVSLSSSKTDHNPK